MTQHETRPNAPEQANPSDRGTHLPYDRDEKTDDATGTAASDAQHDQNRKSIEQAHRDTESGIQDTERRGIPSDVPSSGDNG